MFEVRYFATGETEVLSKLELLKKFPIISAHLLQKGMAVNSIHILKADKGRISIRKIEGYD